MSDTKKSSNFLTIVALLVFAGGIAASYLYKKFLVSNYIAEASLQEPCDLRQDSCINVFPNGESVTFSLNPKDIPILTPLSLHVETKGITASSVKVDFVGLNMDMGFNRSELKLDKPNNYSGKFTIPICVNTRMEWEAQVKLETEKGVMMAPFRFYTVR
ncbi:hypothetical protein GCM10009133_38070 [Cocleimonas flava]|uniref:Uncharacterized protein n=1 Tax=Cocleimonas flava TaxID=634765 RepID=A0A4V2P960_9GAMM|nr:hypothetical protein [Cocleimonas flava]TCJ88355.1 hypothetical protein EV695_0198 [Cocleimonas flava]